MAETQAQLSSADDSRVVAEFPCSERFDRQVKSINRAIRRTSNAKAQHSFDCLFDSIFVSLRDDLSVLSAQGSVRSQRHFRAHATRVR
jgi:hypothetical protein